MTLRSAMKTGLARTLTWTGVPATINRHRRVPFVVCYHRVVERLNATDLFALPAMEISVAMLERHLDWLGRHFRIVSVDDLDRRLEDPRGSLPLAAVTFDDGYSDVFHHALPLLQRKGVPASIFVVTDLVGSEELPVHERLHELLVRSWSRWTSPRQDLAAVLKTARLPEAVRDPFSATRLLLQTLTQADIQRVMESLNRIHEKDRVVPNGLRPLTWEMLATMRDAGMTIGSHSKTHAFLSNESDPRMKEETEMSRQELERGLGVKVRSFAYPGGSFNGNVVQAVATAGYKYAFTICGHRDPQHSLLTIPRTALWEQSCVDSFGRFSPSIMSCQAAGAFRWMSRCTQRHTEAPVSRNTSLALNIDHSI
jgi:peptidoglycan/xylan/chitin deacetylase (PgdA/CDA1 family)